MHEHHLTRLLTYLESHNHHGTYTDAAHHPIWGITNHHNLPHTFPYYGIILGYLTLHRASHKPSYLHKAQEAADALCTLQKPTGQYRYDTFEYNTPRPTGLTLIHNVLPSLALLHLYQTTHHTPYLTTAKKNILWSLCRLWNGTTLTGCVNQDLCAAEALATLTTLDNQPCHLTHAETIANHYLTFQLHDGELTGGFIRGTTETDLIIPWYDAKTAISYHNIYRITHNKNYLDAARRTARFIQKNLTPSGLIHWYHHNHNRWTTIKKPHLIAPAFHAATLLDLFHLNYPTHFLNDHAPTGGYYSSHDYHDERDNPILGWNQFAFIYLATHARKPPPPPPTKPPTPVPQPHRRNHHTTFTGKTISIHKNGYADLIHDHFATTSTPITNRRFTLPTPQTTATLRIRMERSLWKETPLPHPSSVLILPYALKLPIILAQTLSTNLLKQTYPGTLFQALTTIRRTLRRALR